MYRCYLAAWGLLLWLLAQAIAQGGLIERQLPRLPNASEAVWARVDAGALPPGARIRLLTPDGTLIGGAAPFGGPRGQTAASYDFALPDNAIADGRVRLRVEIVEAGGATRPPQPGEAEVELRYVPVTR